MRTFKKKVKPLNNSILLEYRHEALHVATMIGDWLGFPSCTQKNDEPYAYIVQFVANAIGCVLDDRVKDFNGVLLK